MNVYFLGGGNMTTAIVAGMTQQGGYEIEVIDRNQNKRQYLSERYQVRTSAKLTELAATDILVLAVKPQDMQQATHPTLGDKPSAICITGCIHIQTECTDGFSSHLFYRVIRIIFILRSIRLLSFKYSP